jgi:hypothetical protein
MNNGVFFGRLNLKHIKWFLLLGMLVMGSVQANDLDKQLKAAASEVNITTATAGELQLFKDQLIPAFTGAGLGNWQSLAMQQVNYADFITLQELPTAKQGRGFFAINPTVKNNWLLQAPHADSDLYTGKIVSRLFLTGAFKAAQWNTVKRSISDMAHTPDTYWQAFTQAFAGLYPEGKIIQLHGYEQEARRTQAGETSDMILSSGHENPPLWVQQTAACLKKALPWRVSLYPVDLSELGGTINVQGQLLRSLGHNGFLHIEMSKALRQALLDDAELRNKLIHCL